LSEGFKIPNSSDGENFDYPVWDMIEISMAGINALAYMSTKEMTEKVRVRFEEEAGNH